MMKEAVKKYRIDIIMLSETNKRWNLRTKGLLKEKMRSISKDIEIVSSDSGENP